MAIPPQIYSKTASKSAGLYTHFFPAFFFILPDVIPPMFLSTKIEKCQQATFLSLPKTTELVVGTSHSSSAPHANYCYISL
jgi:hypothetical protein